MVVHVRPIHGNGVEDAALVGEAEIAMAVLDLPIGEAAAAGIGRPSPKPSAQQGRVP